MPADQRKEAEQVYALLRAQKASAYRIDAGIIRKRSASDLFAFFTGSLKARLATMVGTLAAATLIVSAVGFLAMNEINQHAKSIYEDRTVPLAQLFEINDRMKDNSLALYGAIANATFRPTGWRRLRQGRSEHRGDQQELVRLHGDLPHARGEGRG